MGTQSVSCLTKACLSMTVALGQGYSKRYNRCRASPSSNKLERDERRAAAATVQPLKQLVHRTTAITAAGAILPAVDSAYATTCPTLSSGRRTPEPA